VARLRVFVSSTCYDLDIVRSELRPFIVNCGYEPVMSDYSDVLFDPRLHTHDSCVKEVVGCDVVVLIIGSRFGGTAVPTALASVDWDAVAGMSSSPTAVLAKDKLSITQLEVIKAVESSVPVYAFVDERVLHDHLVYEKNKDNPLVVDQMVFPSIQKRRRLSTYLSSSTFFPTDSLGIASSDSQDLRKYGSIWYRSGPNCFNVCWKNPRPEQQKLDATATSRNELRT